MSVAEAPNVSAMFGRLKPTKLEVSDGICKQLKLAGHSTYESLIESCKRRFRPVVMTGFSTVVGIIPLVVGSGAGYESRLTIGIVLISGIIFSIFLTLFLTPFFYKIFSKS